MNVRYSPGPWFGVVAPGGIAVLPPGMPVEVVNDVWERMEAGEGLPAVLEALAAAYGTSLKGLPPFGLVLREGDGCRVAIRGPIVVDAGDVGGPISGEGVSTWMERAFPLASAVSIQVPDAADDPVGLLSLVGGVVLCDALAYGERSEPEIDAEEPPMVAPAPVETVAPKEDDAGLTLVPEATVTSEDHDEGSGPPPARDEAPAGVPMRSQASPPATDDGADYDELFGATVVRSVEGAAVRTEGDDGALEGEASPSDSAVAQVRIAPTHPEGPAPSRPAAEPRSPLPGHPVESENESADEGMVSGVPSYLTGERLVRSDSLPREDAPVPPNSPAPAPVAPPPPPPPPPPAEGDHDGLTVSVAQLRAMRAGSTGQDGAPQGTAPARALVSNGEEVVLDRSAVIGRKPRATRTTGDLPHLVTVASPDQDISRSHVELRVESGAILAIDLDTTNGTVLRRAGADPVRLHPHEPTILLDRDVLELGDGVTVTLDGVS